MTEPLPQEARKKLASLLFTEGADLGPEPVGYLAVMRGLLTSEQLEEALAEQRRLAEGGAPRPLADILVERGWMTSDTVDVIERSVAPPVLRRYEIRKGLGEGGMARVYEAFDTELSRPVAVKVMKDPVPSDSPAGQRFRREAQALARLSHPHVVSVYDFGEEDSRLYLVLELVRGRPFTGILREVEGDLQARLELLRKAALGVAHAHENGVVHRDLKPENILLTEAGEPKVADFGLALLGDSELRLSRTGEPQGTPLYMAPEQVEGRRDVTPPTDVYALGVMLYEIMTGRTPFASDSMTQLFARTLSAEPAPPRTLNPSVPKDLQTIALKALEKEPSRRYPTAKEFAEDLRRFLAGEPIAARPSGVLGRLGRRFRRNRVSWVTGVAAVVAALTAVGLGVHGELRARQLNKEREAEAARTRLEREAALEMMRKASVTSLDAALKIRRKGAGPEELRPFLNSLRESYARAVERAADSAEVEYLMGRMRRAMGHDDQALEHQQAALRKEPLYAPALYERALLTSRLYARGVYGASSIEAAEELRPELITLRQRILEDAKNLEAELARGSRAWVNESHALAARGIFAYYQGRPEESKAILKTVVEREPLLEEAWEGLGRVAYDDMYKVHGVARLERMKETERIYTEALSHDRGHLHIWYRRCDVRLQIAEQSIRVNQDPFPYFASAEEDAAQIIQLRSGDPNVYVQRGRILSRRGKHQAAREGSPTAAYDAAEASFLEALKLNPGIGLAHAELGRVRTLRARAAADRGLDPIPDLVRAEKDLTEALRVSSLPNDARTWRAEVRADLGAFLASRAPDSARASFKAAVEDYQEIVKANPKTEPWASEAIRKIEAQAAALPEK